MKYKQEKSVSKLLKSEKNEGVQKLSFFKNFNNELIKKKNIAWTKINKLNKKKLKFVGYGAPAKATTLLNYFGNKNEIKFVIEDNIFKINKYIPGTSTKIIKKNKKIKYDLIIVLAWNYFEKIRKNNYFLAKKFIKIY